MSQVLIESSRAVPLVHVMVAFGAGAACDPAGMSGLASTVGRMLRRGAGGLSGTQIEQSFDALGAKFSGAAVNDHATTLHFKVIRRSIGPFAELVGRMLGRPAFEESVLGALLRETEAELVAARDNDDWLGERALSRLLFADHPYGVLPTVTSLRTIERADVVRFYESFYCRANAIVAIAGDVTEAEGTHIAQAILGALPEGRRAFDPVADPTIAPGRHMLFVEKPGRTQNPIGIGTLGSCAWDSDATALMVANMVFGGMSSGRLMTEVREKRGWSYGAFSSIYAGKHRQDFKITVTPRTADAPNCLALVIDMLHAFIERGVTAEELERAKRYLILSNPFSDATPAGRVQKRLSVALYDLPPDYYTGLCKKAQATTLTEVNEAIRRRLTDEHLAIAAVGAAEHVEPLAAAVPSLRSLRRVPFDRD